MKYIDINSCLEYVDEMFDNSYSRKAKFRWLNEIESRVQLNVMLLQAESTRDYVAEDKVSCNAEFQARSIRLERKIKARAGGTISISGCSIEGNNTDAEIAAVSEDGKTLLFDSDLFSEGTAEATFEYDGGSCTLLAPEPFTDIYYNYVFMKLSEHLEESAEQNNRAVTFDKSFTRFMRWWANTYSPADEKAVFRGYYLVGDRGLPGRNGDRGDPGTSIDHIYNDDYNHMIVVLTDGSEYDAGFLGVEFDPTLSLQGAAAPAGAVGEALREKLDLLDTSMAGKLLVCGSDGQIGYSMTSFVTLMWLRNNYRAAADQDIIDESKAPKSAIGELSQLSTEAKNNLVAAINEIAARGDAILAMRVSEGYIQYTTDNTTWINLIAVADLKGADGAPGRDGQNGRDGTDGQNGITPHIGSNGNWYIGDTDTGLPSRGTAGQNGADGTKWYTGIDYPANAQVGDLWIYTGRNTAHPDGYALGDISQYDGTNWTIVSNIRGATGPAGADGTDGHTPVKGTDYWTAADQQSIVNDVLAALPNGDEVSY